MYTETLDTRWADNDIYGHVNNVAYYAFFDSVINRFLIAAGMDIHRDPVIAFMVASQCRYLKAVAYPEQVRIDLVVTRLGNTSVTYGLTLCIATGEIAAEAAMTHVFVERTSKRPVPVPAPLRAALAQLLVQQHDQNG